MGYHEHQMLELEVSWLLPDGRTGGRTHDGRVVRLRGDAVLGERVRAKLDRQSGRVFDATLIERIAESASRREPTCEWALACGGCDLAAWDPTARAHALKEVVARALRLSNPPELVTDGREEGHRARIDLAIEEGRLGYRRPRSHELVEVGTCRIARPEVQSALQEIRAWLTSNASIAKPLKGVSLRSNGTKVVRVFKTEGPVSDSLTQALKNLPDTATNGQRVSGDPTLEFEVSGLRLTASPLAFFQVHLAMNEQLVQHVIELLSGHTPVLDLYAGVGNFSLPLAHQGARVTAIESEGQALKNLRSNARRLELDVQTIAARVERVDLTQHVFDAVLLDPPRAGARGVLPRIARQRPRRIVYVSCHPPSLARDLSELFGYEISSVRCFDLFPQTHHVETVVALDRIVRKDTPVLSPHG